MSLLCYRIYSELCFRSTVRGLISIFQKLGSRIEDRHCFIFLHSRLRSSLVLRARVSYTFPCVFDCLRSPAVSHATPRSLLLLVSLNHSSKISVVSVFEPRHALSLINETVLS